MNINYMLISFIILILAAIPFIISFERRKPRAREVVLIAMMSAITVLANVVCAYTIPFHAGTAMVIITGVAFGPETGFLVGALSRLTCNFFMGQGMWTPWQMVAWGILGALAGACFSKTTIIGYFEDKKEIKKKRTKAGGRALITPVACIIFCEVLGYLVFIVTAVDDTFFGWWIYAFGLMGIICTIILRRGKLPANCITLSAFSFIVVFVIYGGIMNLATLLMNTSIAVDGATDVTWSALKMLYISGAPYDAFHALGAAACTFVFGESMIQKLERVKIKYGLYNKQG